MVKKSKSTWLAMAFHKLTGCVNDRWECGEYVGEEEIGICLPSYS